MLVNPYQMKCKKNQVDKTNYIFPIQKENENHQKENIVWDCHFKYGGSIMNVELIVKFDDEIHAELLKRTNYIFIKKLGRYYFVDNIEFLQGGQYKLVCSIDVLNTYSSKITSTSQLIRRNPHEYNGLYQDEKFPIDCEKMVSYKSITGSPFSRHNMVSGGRCIVLTCAGGAY